MFKRRLLEHITISRLIAAFVVYLLPLLIFVQLAVEVQERSTPVADIATLHWLHGFASPMLDRLAIMVTNMGGPGVVTAVMVGGVLVLYAIRRRRAAVVLLAGVGGAAIINTLLKLSFQRVRPELWVPVVHETSFSFPSGHAMVSSALAASLIYILWRTRWRWWAIGLGLAYTFVIGLTRVYLGVHFPTDVLGGWIVGFSWVVVLRAVLHRSRRWRAKGITEPSATTSDSTVS